MKHPVLIVSFILSFSSLCGQNNYNNFNKHFKAFREAESFETSKEIFEKLENYACMVSFYPTMAIAAIEQGYRPDAIHYLYDALRYGYRIKDLQKGHPDAYKSFSQLTIDSLLQYINLSKTIAFNWQHYLELSDIFIEEDANSNLANVDSNGRILVVPLRNLIYQYMRVHGFPSDCQVGYGMQNKTMISVINYSRYLHDFEFEELEGILKTAMQSYQITVDYYVFIVDYYYFLNGRTSKFASLDTSGNEELEKFIASHLQEINSARQNLGLAKIILE